MLVSNADGAERSEKHSTDDDKFQKKTPRLAPELLRKDLALRDFPEAGRIFGGIRPREYKVLYSVCED
jgi:hypothetical protein